MDTNFDSVDATNGYKHNGEPLPLTEGVIKTVGVGKDFELFHDAMVWATSQVQTAGGYIRLVLDDGVHLIGEPESFNTYEWVFYDITSEIHIESASEDKSLCTIAMPSTDDGQAWPSIFRVKSGYFYVSQITFDFTAAGYPYSQNVTLGYVEEGGTGSIYGSTITDGYSAMYAQGGTVKYHTCLIDDCDTGIPQTYDPGTVQLKNTTISNSTTVGISVLPSSAYFAGSHVQMDNVTMTTNTADYDVPLNEIQYNGAVISNGAAGLTLKA